MGAAPQTKEPFGTKEVASFLCFRGIQVRTGQQHLLEPSILGESRLKGKSRAKARCAEGTRKAR